MNSNLAVNFQFDGEVLLFAIKTIGVFACAVFTYSLEGIT